MEKPTEWWRIGRGRDEGGEETGRTKGELLQLVSNGFYITLKPISEGIYRRWPHETSSNASWQLQISRIDNCDASSSSTFSSPFIVITLRRNIILCGNLGKSRTYSLVPNVVNCWEHLNQNPNKTLTLAYLCNCQLALARSWHWIGDSHVRRGWAPVTAVAGDAAAGCGICAGVTSSEYSVRTPSSPTTSNEGCSNDETAFDANDTCKYQSLRTIRLFPLTQ